MINIRFPRYSEVIIRRNTSGDNSASDNLPKYPISRGTESVPTWYLIQCSVHQLLFHWLRRISCQLKSISTLVIKIALHQTCTIDMTWAILCTSAGSDSRQAIREQTHSMKSTSDLCYRTSTKHSLRLKCWNINSNRNAWFSFRVSVCFCPIVIDRFFGYFSLGGCIIVRPWSAVTRRQIVRKHPRLRINP